MLIQSLRFESIGFRYENSDPVLKNVDFAFPMSITNIIRGEHGSGRSSLLQIMAGLLIPQEGRYLINEKDVAQMSFEEFLPYRLSIGYGFDLGGLISNKSLYDNLVLPLLYHRMTTPEKAHQRVIEYMERFNLIKYKDQRPAHVSGGIRKTTCVIRSIIMAPEILILDDPTVGLSKESTQIFADCIFELQKEGHTHTAFISSYDENFISQFPHENIYLEGAMLFKDPEQSGNVVNL